MVFGLFAERREKEININFDGTEKYGNPFGDIGNDETNEIGNGFIIIGESEETETAANKIQTDVEEESGTGRTLSDIPNDDSHRVP